MKVMLIASNVTTSPYPVYPLGMSMVARSLQEAGHELLQFDFLSTGAEIETLKLAVSEFAPDMIGVSMRNIDNVNFLNEQRYTSMVQKIVKEIRTVSSAKIVLGGTAFSILPEAMLCEIGADYGIVGEGERLIVKLAEIIANKQEPETKILRAEPSLKGSQMRNALYDAEIMRFYLENGSIANVQTKRGCTSKCVYCSYPSLEGSTFRIRDVNDTVDDIQKLVEEHDAKMVFFTDSVFNDPQGKYIELLNEMKRRNLSVPWTAYIKPELFDQSIIDLMKETGVKGVELGADAASDIALKGIGKSFNWKMVVDCNNLFADNGIATAHYFMFGGPLESKESVIEGIDNIVNLKRTASFMFMGIRILPNTGLEKIALKDGVISQEDDLLEPKYYIAPGLDKDWMEKTMKEGFKGYRHCVFPPDALEDSVKFLQKMGHKGLMWDMLIPVEGRRKRRKKNDR